ncbi:sulfate/molybdate ABC transporter ATP-binding protein [soil metagenome]
MVGYLRTHLNILVGFGAAVLRETDAAGLDLQSKGQPVDVVVENVSRSFANTVALDDVSLKVASGELVALLGPSGSGKTTLLRILGGLDFPSAGRVLFGSEDALRLSVRQRNVGFVFQSYALFRHMTVFDNVAFGLTVRPAGRRPSRAVIRERVNELLDLVQLGDLGKRFPAQLSGGQRQRVALARALAIEPRILLLDEPFGALDAKVRKDLRRWLRDLHDRTGHTTVFVTHDQEEALELADRVAILNRGRLEQIGTPDAVYDAPETPFVASFIGENNALPVTVESGTIFLDDRPFGPAAGEADGPRTLAFRPHDVAVGDSDAPGIAGIVVSELRHGATRRLAVETGMRRHRIEIDVAAEAATRKGQRVVLHPQRWRLLAENEYGAFR